MNLLLDSHVLLWALHDPSRLTKSGRDAIRDPKRLVYFSVASAWELELKASKGKLSLPAHWLSAAEKAGFVELPVGAQVASMSAQLPWHHSDPFDRLLIAQAISDGLQLATRDAVMSRYRVSTLEV